jgi:hypothetical protein
MYISEVFRPYSGKLVMTTTIHPIATMVFLKEQHKCELQANQSMGQLHSVVSGKISFSFQTGGGSFEFFIILR